MRKKIFKAPKGGSFYEISANEDYVTIKWAIDEYDNMSEEKLSDLYIDNFTMHIGNIPHILEAMDYAFRAPMGRGDIKKCESYGEEISCLSDTERGSVKRLTFGVEKDDNYQIFEIYTNPYDIRGEAAKRKYTPEMLWISKQLMGIYKKWEKEQNK